MLAVVVCLGTGGCGSSEPEGLAPPIAKAGADRTVEIEVAALALELEFRRGLAGAAPQRLLDAGECILAPAVDRRRVHAASTFTRSRARLAPRQRTCCGWNDDTLG